MDTGKDESVYTLVYVYRWIIAVILCCLILLVAVCNLLGLMLGPAGLVPKDHPTARSSTANCGGLFLMAYVQTPQQTSNFCHYCSYHFTLLHKNMTCETARSV